MPVVRIKSTATLRRRCERARRNQEEGREGRRVGSGGCPAAPVFAGRHDLDAPRCLPHALQGYKKTLRELDFETPRTTKVCVFHAAAGGPEGKLAWGKT